MQVPLFVNGLYVAVIYLGTAIYFVWKVMQFAHPWWRKSCNQRRFEWIMSFALPLLALELLGSYAHACLEQNVLGIMAYGLHALLVLVNNFLYIFKLSAVIGLSLYYLKRVIYNYKSGYWDRLAILDLLILIFFVLTLAIHLLDRSGNNFLGSWNQLSRAI